MRNLGLGGVSVLQVLRLTLTLVDYSITWTHLIAGRRSVGRGVMCVLGMLLRFVLLSNCSVVCVI
jgi:hypothetical protein